MQIWIDADACPRDVKDVVFRFSGKRKLPVILVANSWMRIPDHPLVRLEVVKNEVDEADNFIHAQVKQGDIVITADVPLAAALVERKAVVINPRGLVYTDANVHEALASRDLMENLREDGTLGSGSGGPSGYSKKDLQSFTNSLDRELTRALKGG